MGDIMSAKDLGMIHTANAEIFVADQSPPGVMGCVDVSGILTTQLQRQIRQGQYFKTVGIDIGIDTTGVTGGGQISGELRYLAPTRGRCQAYRDAFKSMVDVMALQGISMRDNHQYDFRVPLTPAGASLGSVDPVTGLQTPLPNLATLDGTSDGLVMTDPLGINVGREVIHVHNRSVQPQYDGSAGDQFQPGFNTLLQTVAGGGTDFVLNDTVMLTGNEDYASPEFESIPFVLTWTPDSTDQAVMFQWKPDPALYLAVMTGQFDVQIEEMELDGGNTTGLNLRIAVHVAGWKSIMGNPDRKRRSSRK
jgi:hypothetical protein